jgi:4-amino-4-deoxy-L-arabinose transferase-like glycosyltransferase
MRDMISARIWKLFLAAIAIRCAYALLLFMTMGEDGLMEVDSYGYVDGARSFATAIANHSLAGWQWLSPQLHVMPLFGWTLALHMLAFGTFGSLAFVLTQGVLDAGTCILVYAIARSLDERYALPAGIAAAINPTQIVLAGLVFTDTQFTFFVALSLYAATRWMAAPSWRWSTATAAAVGAASLTRPIGALWIPVLAFAMLLYSAVKWRLSARVFAQVAGTAAIMALCLTPVIWRNVSLYGSWALTPQGGLHLARWVVPLVKEARDRTPWMQTSEDMERLTRERFGRPHDLFELSRQYSEVGREQLAALGAPATVKAWSTGALINLSAPAIILSPPIILLPRTGYFATQGTSTFDKIEKFLFHSESALYTWALLLGIAGVAVMRLIQLAGLVAMLRRREHWPVLALFGLWIAFVLAVNGPIATPKYRLPIEPALMVMTGAGICTLSRWRRGPKPA